MEKWLIGAVARVFEPGCKNDYALILQGEQGIGKSTFFSILGGIGFDSSMPDLGSKDSLLILHRCWVQELSEFEKVTSKKAAAEIKAFLTNATDIFRKPYGEKTEEHPRRSVFCGSVNKATFLLDETGNRRFWIIPIPPSVTKINTMLLAKERDDIWASAVQAYQEGQIWHLTPEEERQVTVNNERFEVTDEWESEIEDYLDNQVQTSIKWILQNKFDLSPVEQDKRTQMRVSSILVKLGWSKAGRKRIKGKREVIWEKQEKTILKSFLEGVSSVPSVVNQDKSTNCSVAQQKGVSSLERLSGNDSSLSSSKSALPDPTYHETFQKFIFVTYNNQKYKVLHKTHSHFQLEGLEKAVPIWECEYLK